MTQLETSSKKDTKTVKVTFAVSPRGPYTATEPGGTTIATVLAAAKKHFRVVDDPQFVYVLAFDGQDAAGDATLDDVAGDARHVKFTLVKKITQG
ncbi:hypothetical protein [Asanoa siamensis]|uniref:Uncharacterized protein n=1 Tax=Asanoa siamensis TaxID=926357 RepID=A0ABQ4CY28_9ACTN|nr:hypothetical protein [Asanoa siamensis]GIF76189.1 hypothetical protein Asi02nite_57070 [Asanoa siamensis]